jgi:hypothetical protein
MSNKKSKLTALLVIQTYRGGGSGALNVPSIDETKQK